MTMILSKVQIVEKLGSTEWENPYEYMMKLKRGGFSDGQIGEMLRNRGMAEEQVGTMLNEFHTQLEMIWSSRLIKRQVQLFLLFTLCGFVVTSFARLYSVTNEIFMFSAIATLIIFGGTEVKRYFQ